MEKRLHHFEFWCQKILPLVYDDSLSYYETLCKVVEYLNNVISTVDETTDEMQGLKSELAVVQKWIADFEPSVANEIIEKYIARGVYFGLTQSGYFCAYIPSTWANIRFRTTGYDIELPQQPKPGHLVLMY